MADQLLPASWRHRLRISVRGLILLVLIVGGWLGWLVRSARIQREAVAAIQRDGGWVYYDWQRAGDLVYDALAKPGGPRWLSERVGVDYYSNPVYVTLERFTHGLRTIQPFGTSRGCRAWSP